MILTIIVGIEEGVELRNTSRHNAPTSSAPIGRIAVAVADGRLGFRPHLVRQEDFLTEAKQFDFYDLDGEKCRLNLDPGTMAFTVCQAPVVAHRSGPQRIEITRADGSLQTVAALELDAAASSAVFERSRDIRRLDVFFGLEDKGAPK